jgi:hypothetical protein
VLRLSRSLGANSGPRSRPPVALRPKLRDRQFRTQRVDALAAVGMLPEQPAMPAHGFRDSVGFTGSGETAIILGADTSRLGCSWGHAREQFYTGLKTHDLLSRWMPGGMSASKAQDCRLPSAGPNTREGTWKRNGVDGSRTRLAPEGGLQFSRSTSYDDFDAQHPNNNYSNRGGA